MDPVIIANEAAFDGLLEEAAALAATLQASAAFSQYQALRQRAAANRVERARLGTARFVAFAVRDTPYRKGLPLDPLGLAPHQSQQLQRMQQQQPRYFHPQQQHPQLSGGQLSTVSGGQLSTVSGGQLSTVSGGQLSTVSGGTILECIHQGTYY
jgi:hypothetical protein